MMEFIENKKGETTLKSFLLFVHPQRFELWTH